MTDEAGVHIEHGQLAAIRRAELERVRPWFPAGARVLEIGAHDGSQAAALAEWGCTVTALDVQPAPIALQRHPVSSYDGVHLPFEDGQFDRIFTSNTLEHVTELDALVAETARVLAPDGLAVHVLPSSTWRLWTSLAHYPFVAKQVWGLAAARVKPRHGSTEAADEHVGGILHQRLQDRGALWAVRRALLPGPHGEYSSAAAEVFCYSRRRWVRYFAGNRFVVRRSFGTQLFYTGYGLAPGLGIDARIALARWLGSSCNVFVAAPRGLVASTG